VTTLQLLVRTPAEANQVMNNLYREVVKPHTAHGGAGILTWQSESQYLREKHRAFFHGPLLRAFAQQVWLHDPKLGRARPFSKDVWKELLKREFLEPKLEEYTVRSTGEVKYRLRALSTEALSNDEYNDFLHQCMALGHELGVDFNEEGT
jgi:hypothetical protein